ncbi:hypothetical protein HPB49_017245 [Dermacentor silvarum]|uniref:Uncharacterized protein n=1 Tax=Dermacentor silvarum TaxID=543639 RepID=A0ACB8C4M8_DERSI|nr:hypothetical protein HPB49_017245 [Dermacentor silvarum]
MIRGDFNSENEAWEYSRTTARGRMLADAMETAGLELANDISFSTRMALYAKQKDTTTDYSWASLSIVKEWCYGCNLMGSDHYLTWVELNYRQQSQTDSTS